MGIQRGLVEGRLHAVVNLADWQELLHFRDAEASLRGTCVPLLWRLSCGSAVQGAHLQHVGVCNTLSH